MYVIVPSMDCEIVLTNFQIVLDGLVLDDVGIFKLVRF